MRDTSSNDTEETAVSDGKSVPDEPSSRIEGRGSSFQSTDNPSSFIRAYPFGSDSSDNDGPLTFKRLGSESSSGDSEINDDFPESKSFSRKKETRGISLKELEPGSGTSVSVNVSCFDEGNAKAILKSLEELGQPLLEREIGLCDNPAPRLGSYKSMDTIDETPYLGKKKKLRRIIFVTMRILSLIPILYMFVCSLDLLTSGFQLLAGKTAGDLFSKNNLLKNPIAGLMIGVIVTILVQSSSTTTSIIVSMVSAGIIPVRYSIPMIMGANVGTSTTNTLVSLGQMDVVDEFKRAFAGATIHDAFNWMNVIVQLPLEAGTGFLYRMTSAMVRSINSTSSVGEPQFLQVLTKPLTNSIIQINWTVVENIAQNISMPPNVTLRKLWCNEEIQFNETLNQNFTQHIPCNYLLLKLKWPDWGIGLLLTIISLIVLMMCLMLLVWNLRKLLEGKISKILRKTIDKDFPGVFKHVTPYVFIMVGIGLTIIVQSSSVFTSVLTPLVGAGVISLKRMYPLTLGSNVGTTVTAILSALTAPTVDRLRNSLQAALCHLFFNVFGIVIFFVIVPMRRLPLEVAKFLGRETAKYRWFSILYLIVAFIIVPGVLLGLSIAGLVYALTFLILMILLIVVICIVNYLMKHKSKYLPGWLRSWQFLPEPMRSLAPLDRFLMRIRLFVRSYLPAKVIRPDLSVTSMTHLFRHKDNNLSSNTLA